MKKNPKQLVSTQSAVAISPINPKRIIAFSLLGLGLIGVAYAASKVIGGSSDNQTPDGVDALPDFAIQEEPSSPSPSTPSPQSLPPAATSSTTTPSTAKYNLNRQLSQSGTVKLEVKIMQKFLNEVDSVGQENKIKVDGQFGPATLKRVRQYMQDSNIKTITLADLKKENPNRLNMVLESYGLSGIVSLFGLPLFQL